MSKSTTEPRPVDYSEAAEAFRAEVRAWLAENGPGELRGITAAPRDPGPELRSRLRHWAAQMTEAGLMCITWPTEYGGRGLSVRPA